MFFSNRSDICNYFCINYHEAFILLYSYTGMTHFCAIAACSLVTDQMYVITFVLTHISFEILASPLGIHQTLSHHMC